METIPPTQVPLKIKFEFTETQIAAMIRVLHDGYHSYKTAEDDIGVKVTQTLAAKLYSSLPKESQSNQLFGHLVCMLSELPKFKAVLGQLMNPNSPSCN